MPAILAGFALMMELPAKTMSPWGLAVKSSDRPKERGLAGAACRRQGPVSPYDARPGSRRGRTCAAP